MPEFEVAVDWKPGVKRVTVLRLVEVTLATSDGINVWTSGECVSELVAWRGLAEHMFEHVCELEQRYEGGRRIYRVELREGETLEQYREKFITADGKKSPMHVDGLGPVGIEHFDEENNCLWVAK